MYMRVRATAGAKKERLERQGPDHFDIWVKEPAERNLANARIRELVARELGVKMHAVRIISGHRSQMKVMSIDL